MSAAYTDADRTRLVPPVRDDSEPGGDRMNGFEVVVNAALDFLPHVFFLAVYAFVTAAALVHALTEMSAPASILAVLVLIASGRSFGAYVRRLRPVPPPPAVHTPVRQPVQWRFR